MPFSEGMWSLCTSRVRTITPRTRIITAVPVGWGGFGFLAVSRGFPTWDWSGLRELSSRSKWKRDAIHGTAGNRPVIDVCRSVMRVGVGMVPKRVQRVQGTIRTECDRVRTAWSRRRSRPQGRQPDRQSMRRPNRRPDREPEAQPGDGALMRARTRQPFPSHPCRPGVPLDYPRCISWNAYNGPRRPWHP